MTDDTRAEETSADAQGPHRLCEITLDESSIIRTNVNVEHEREVAIYDILDANTFEVVGRDDGPYALSLAMIDDRLVMKISDTAAVVVSTLQISMTPLKRLMKDYFKVLDSYYQAVRTAQPSRIQAIDMGRRGLHDEGSQILIDELEGKVAIDFDTARRLFTLISALHWKG